MVFGDSSFILKHSNNGATIHFDAFDALSGWKQEGLPSVEVPTAAQWRFRSKTFQQVILDYDYTFTTPYVGSENIELRKGAWGKLFWEDCEEKIYLAALAAIEPILFYDEIVLYEDELADNGVSLLTVKVLRDDGVLIRLRDTRMYCRFEDTNTPSVLKKSAGEKPSSNLLEIKFGFTSFRSFERQQYCLRCLPNKTYYMECPD